MFAHQKEELDILRTRMETFIHRTLLDTPQKSGALAHLRSLIFTIETPLEEWLDYAEKHGCDVSVAEYRKSRSTI